MNELNVEELEKEVFFKFGWIFKNSINDFSTSVDKSLGYLDKIILPTLIASKQDKSYNPFSEIIEKYALHILINKLEKENYNLLPLGYSSDLTLESKDHILNIDIKTANINNPSDFRNTIPIGINQMTHVAKLPLNRRYLPDPYFVYPTIPAYYEFPNGKIKWNLTYGLMFIYPSYKDLMDEMRVQYLKLFDFFKKKVVKSLIPILKRKFKINQEDVIKILEKKPEKSTQTRKEIITESIIRGFFIHEYQRKDLMKNLEISPKDSKIIESFSIKLKDFSNNLRKRDLKPIAIIAISLPNGLLKEKYVDRFVSGKSYGKSARYHYEDGVFEIIKEINKEVIPRILFIDLNKNYEDELKKFFDEIYILDYKLKKL